VRLGNNRIRLNKIGRGQGQLPEQNRLSWPAEVRATQLATHGKNSIRGRSFSGRRTYPHNLGGPHSRAMTACFIGVTLTPLAPGSSRSSIVAAWRG
jgi:hypothetical protein